MSIFEGGKFRSFIPSMNKNNTTIEKNHHLYKKKYAVQNPVEQLIKKKKNSFHVRVKEKLW
jgi:hypothetical protein